MICPGFQRSLGLAAAAAFSFSTVCQGAGLGKGWKDSQESWADSLTEKCNFSEHSENAEHSGERELRGQFDSPERNISSVIKKKNTAHNVKIISNSILGLSAQK